MEFSKHPSLTPVAGMTKRPKNIETFDDFLNELGNPGKYRLLLLLMNCGLMFPVGFNFMLTVFIGFVPKHRCKTLHQNITDQPEIFSNATSVGSCELWNNPNNHSEGTTTCIHGMEYELEDGEWFVSTELDLVCERKYFKTIVLTIEFVGIMLGGIIAGYISDQYGRRAAIIIFTVSLSIFSVALAFTSSLLSFVICVFCLGIAIEGTHSSSFTFCSELFHTNHRTYQGMVMNMPWALTIALDSFLFWILRRWNYVQMVIGFSSLIACVYVWFLPESLRWLMTRGRVEEVYDQYVKFRTFNKRTVDSTIKKDLQSISSTMIEFQTDREKASFKALFQSKRLMKCTIILGAIYFLADLLFLEVNLIIPKLGGNKYVCYIISGCLQIIAIISSLFISQRIGRRTSLMSATVIESVSFGFCCIARNYMLGGETTSEYLSITFALLGMYMNSAVCAILSLYMTEVYPTLLRGIGISFIIMCGRMGGITAPAILLLETFWDPLPIVLASVCGVVVGLSVLLLPETNKKPLPDSVAEVQNLYRNNNR